MQHIGKNIKKIIDESSLKQKEIASLIGENGISIQHLHNLFGKENVDTKYLFQLSEILKLPVTAFFDGENGLDLNSELQKLKEDLSVHKAGLKHLSKRVDQQTALLALIRSRLKTSISIYKMYENNMPTLDPGSIEYKSRSELFEIITETYNELIAAISLSQSFTLDMIESEKYNYSQIKEYWKTTLDIDLNTTDSKPDQSTALENNDINAQKSFFKQPEEINIIQVAKKTPKSKSV